MEAWQASRQSSSAGSKGLVLLIGEGWITSPYTKSVILLFAMTGLLLSYILQSSDM